MSVEKKGSISNDTSFVSIDILVLVFSKLKNDISYVILCGARVETITVIVHLIIIISKEEVSIVLSMLSIRSLLFLEGKYCSEAEDKSVQ